MSKKEFGNFILIPVIYSLGVTLAIYAAIQELHRFNNTSQFLIFTSAIFAIIILEIIMNYIARSNKVVLNMDFTDEVNELSHLFNKIVIPITLYISMIGFGYYNLGSNVFGIILILTFILFFVLFINIRAFFQNQLTVESKTHYIYDFFKFIIFFLGVDLVINFSQFNLVTLVLGIFGLSIILQMLLLIRQKGIYRKYYLYALVSSTIISVSGITLVATNNFSPLQISLCLVFLFYLSLAIIQHAITHTLTKSILIEYILVLLIATSILLGVS